MCIRDRFRHRQPEQAVSVRIAEEGVFLSFREKQRAITEGQYAVLYRGNRCIGGGVIERAIF